MKWYTWFGAACFLLLIAMALFGCQPNKEPRFSVGQAVEFKGLGLPGRIRSVHCSPFSCKYNVRLYDGFLTTAHEVELEPRTTP